MVDIEALVKESIDLLAKEVSIDKLIDKHLAKVHFIPIKYRVLGGFLQSLNIRFGDLIETLISKIIESSPHLEVLISRKKNIQLELNPECEKIINEHIDYPLKKEEISVKLPSHLEELYTKVFRYQLEGQNFVKKSLDVDTLFRDKSREKFYYVEIKYNDDHDTGKFMDINRKILKTYAGLIRYLKVKDKDDFKLILYYFNYYKRYYPSPYLRESIEILRGEEFFREFNLPISYNEIDIKLRELENKLEAKFDELREEIFKRVKERMKAQRKTLLDYDYQKT